MQPRDNIVARERLDYGIRRNLAWFFRRPQFITADEAAIGAGSFIDENRQWLQLRHARHCRAVIAASQGFHKIVTNASLALVTNAASSPRIRRSFGDTKTRGRP
jgi:hypothetical protein